VEIGGLADYDPVAFQHLRANAVTKASRWSARRRTHLAPSHFETEQVALEDESPFWAS
jgi:hypothetical protein